MKTIAILLLVLGTVFPATAQLVTNQPARLKSKITCYEGKIGFSAASTAIDFAVNSYPGTSNTSTVTSPGKESELIWTFIGRNGSKDVYRFTFTRLTKAGSSARTMDSKEVQFDGKRIVVFEDELHTVVMETPSAEDLKWGEKPRAK